MDERLDQAKPDALTAWVAMMGDYSFARAVRDRGSNKEILVREFSCNTRSGDRHSLASGGVVTKEWHLKLGLVASLRVFVQLT